MEKWVPLLITALFGILGAIGMLLITATRDNEIRIAKLENSVERLEELHPIGYTHELRGGGR